MTDNTNNQINTDDILTVANLARLHVTDDTASHYAKDINKILSMMDTLANVDTDGISPLANIHESTQALRNDIANAEIDREANLSNAPTKQDGLFLVPQVIE